MADRMKPKVSIVAISYNHEKYMRQALDSFVNQKANFDFEIIVGDDCSTDKSASIIKEYADKYPDLFKPILRTRNLGVQKNFEDTINKANGEYIALCECDDFWTDKNKIQTQADFLDKNKEISFCFHPAYVFFEDKPKIQTVFPNEADFKEFNSKQLIKQNFMITNTVMYRNTEKLSIPEGILPVDWYVHLYYAQFGEIGYIDRNMSSYRRHQSGMWWEATKDVSKIWHKYGNAHFKLYVEMRKLFEKQKDYQKIIDKNIDNAFEYIAEADAKYRGNLLGEIIHDYPEEVDSYIKRQLTQLESNSVLNMNNQAQIDRLQSDISDKEKQLKQTEQELAAINMSRVWKLRNKIVGKTKSSK
jgi:glycosyltransferase involved in cell wall biosynthesis